MSDDEVIAVNAHAHLVSIYPAMKQMEHLRPLEVQLERDHYWPEVRRYFRANMVHIGTPEQELREDYNDITNRIIRAKLAQQELKAAVRKKGA